MSKHVFLIFVSALMLLGFVCGQNGICSRNISKTMLVPETYNELYLENYTKRCGFLWIKKCKRTRTNYRISIRMKTETFTETELYCCSGYKQVTNTTLICETYCSKPCINGWCSKLEVCTPYAGYKLNPSDKYKSDPVCEKPCVNGLCSEPEVCTPNIGYSLDPNDKYKSVPICSKPCVLGHCSKPEVCTPNAGYSLDPKDKYKSIPICSKPCINGICSKPEICTPNAGYSLDLSDKYKSNPICNPDCKNGECVSPNICKCNEGFQLNEKKICEEKCRYECVKGKCVNGVCHCDDGYFGKVCDFSFIDFVNTKVLKDDQTKNWHISAIFGLIFAVSILVSLFFLLITKKSPKGRHAQSIIVEMSELVINDEVIL